MVLLLPSDFQNLLTLKANVYQSLKPAGIYKTKTGVNESRLILVSCAVINFESKNLKIPV